MQCTRRADKVKFCQWKACGRQFMANRNDARYCNDAHRKAASRANEAHKTAKKGRQRPRPGKTGKVRGGRA
jgi:hypothetical protein